MDASVSSVDMQFAMGFLKVQWPTNLIKWSDSIFLPQEESGSSADDSCTANRIVKD